VVLPDQYKDHIALWVRDSIAAGHGAIACDVARDVCMHDSDLALKWQEPITSAKKNSMSSIRVYYVFYTIVLNSKLRRFGLCERTDECLTNEGWFVPEWSLPMAYEQDVASSNAWCPDKVTIIPCARFRPVWLQ
jgi:hypothetical protein